VKQKLLKFYAAQGGLGKFFIWYSVLLFLTLILVYLLNLLPALNMDKTSYACTHDSMMMQLCHKPFIASLGWTVVYIVLFGLPFVLGWIILGATLMIRRILNKRPSQN